MKSDKYIASVEMPIASTEPLVIRIAMEMKNKALLCFLALLILPDSHAAEITDGNKDCWGPCAYLNGEIEPGDLVKLESLFHSPTRARSFNVVNQEIYYLALNSLGGSLEEAMEIGRWVRKNKISTSMPMHSQCFSACVYILAAGVSKQVSYELWGTKVGIHRPYLTRMPREDVQVAMRKALVESKAYLAQMNIPEQLADAMFSIPPDNVEILTDEKLSFYRLNGMDIAFEEESELKAAALYGMSRQQYMKNKQLFADEVKAKCDHLRGDEGLRCVINTATKYGLSESQMKRSQ
jgi:hypothetical protein